MPEKIRGFLSRWALPAVSVLIPCLLSTSCTEEPGTAPVDLTNAVVVVSSSTRDSSEHMAATTLVEEVASRTGLTWQTVTEPPAGAMTVIRLAVAPEEALRAEGFRIATTRQNGTTTVSITGADGRGVLFGVGYLLRKLNWERGAAALPGPIDIATSPAYALRGHQLGYRNTANSYDAWDVAKYDTYIRELSLFGTNAIENIPFHQLEQPGPLMPIPQLEMNTEISRVCARYGLGFWMFIAATGDLADPAYRREFMELNEQTYAECPAIEAVFVPGGDPGENHPRLLLPALRDLNARLRRHHPEAGVWVSMQKFTPEMAEYFFTTVGRDRPNYISGIVDGPWGPPPEEIQRRLGSIYPIRVYPDINHNVRCQFPVPWWDQAYVLTLGREASNPRPVGFSHIIRAYMPGSSGVLTYSDGIHDDVNKVIWSALAWDPEADVREVLVDYSRLFFGPEVAERAADGILALEQNWVGPLTENVSVDSTLAHWQRLEEEKPAALGQLALAAVAPAGIL